MTTRRVLNVNDSSSNRYYVSRVLRAAGWEVLEAETGAMGLEIARRESPSIVILDIKLPDMNGLEVCRMLRSDPRTADVIVIQTSATFVTSEGKARGLESGADQYLTQPFEPVELIAMTRNLLRMREKEIEAREKANALAEADKRKDEFLAMLAHELRNPLSGIALASSLLSEEPLDSRSQKLTATIVRQTRHLARLVDDLLDVSRITLGKIQLRIQPIDLGAIVRRAIEVDIPLVGRDREVVVEVSDAPMWIQGDVTRVEQILSNLLANAVKYTERGSRISVSLAPDGPPGARKAILRVRDQGIGIAKENLGAIFDLFFQADDSLARTQSGLGVGLTIVKRLLEMQGANITAESAGLGTGTAFRVEFPMIAAPTEAPADTVSGVHARPLSVLLIDDNFDSCELCAFSFERDGHRVRSAHDGREGLQIALEDDFDLAVVDIGLPGIDGYEIARQLRAQERTRELTMIALTGYGRDEDRRRALEAGFDAHLVKPIDIDQLERVVSSLLAKKAS